MAVPKRRKSKSKRDMRKAHDKRPGVNVSTCPECAEPKLHHRACPSCGTYKSRTVVEVED